MVICKYITYANLYQYLGLEWIKSNFQILSHTKPSHLSWKDFTETRHILKSFYNIEIYHDIISNSGETHNVSFSYYINFYTIFPYLIKMVLLHMNGQTQDIKRKLSIQMLL